MRCSSWDFCCIGRKPSYFINKGIGAVLLPDPPYKGSPGSSSTEMRKVQAVSQGCHSARSALLSITSNGVSPLACEVFAHGDAACCFCLFSVTCSDLPLAGNVREVMAITSQTGPLRERSQTLVVS